MNDLKLKMALADGVANDELDNGSCICESCAGEFWGSSDEAFASGWRFGWNGWVCERCDVPIVKD